MAKPNLPTLKKKKEQAQAPVAQPQKQHAAQTLSPAERFARSPYNRELIKWLEGTSQTAQSSFPQIQRNALSDPQSTQSYLTGTGMHKPGNGNILSLNDEAMRKARVDQEQIKYILTQQGAFDSESNLTAENVDLTSQTYRDNILPQLQQKLKDSQTADAEQQKLIDAWANGGEKDYLTYEANASSFKNWLTDKKNQQYDFSNPTEDDLLYINRALNGGTKRSFNWSDPADVQLYNDLYAQWQGIDFENAAYPEYTGMANPYESGYESKTEGIQSQIAAIQSENNRQAAKAAMEAELSSSPSFNQTRLYRKPGEHGQGLIYSLGSQGTEERLYNYINGYWFTDPITNEAYDSSSGFTSGVAPDWYTKGYDLLTEQEKAYANAAYAEGRLQEYLDIIQPSLSRRRRDVQTGMIQTVAENPVAGTLLDIPMAVAKPAGDFLSWAGAAVGVDDVNNPVYAISEGVNTFRETRANEAENVMPGYGSFVYNTATGAEDFIYQAILGRGASSALGGAVSPSAASSAVMGLSASGSTIAEDIKEGYSPETAMVHGLANYALEMVSEKLPLDTIFSGDGFLKSGVTEFLEEAFSGAVDPGVQAIFAAMEGKPNEVQQVYNYFKDTLPEGEDPATATFKYYANNVLQQGLSGFAIGGGANLALSLPIRAQNKATGKAVVDNDNVSRVLEIGQSMPTNSRSYKDATALKADLDANKKLNLGKLGRLANSMSVDLGQENSRIVDQIFDEAIVDRMVELGDDKNIAQESVEAVKKASRGEKLNKQERAVLAETGSAAQVVAELAGEATNEEGQSAGSEWTGKMQMRAIEATADIRSKQADLYKAVSGRQAEQSVFAPENEAASTKVVKAKPGTGAVTFIGDASSNQQVTGSGTEAALNNRMRSMTASQRNTVNGIKAIAKATGVNVVLFESTAEGRAAGVQNGSFVRGTNTIYLDVNAGISTEAGMKGAKESGVLGYAMIRTMSHELTHFIEANGKAGYSALMEQAKREFAAKGKDWDKLVVAKAKMSAAQGEKLTRTGAEAEVLADACEMMLQDTAAIERLARRNPSLKDKIAGFIRNFVQKIQKALQAIGAGSTEAKALMDMRDGLMQYSEELSRLWGAGLEEAVVNAQSVEQQAVELSDVNTKFSLRQEPPPKKTGIAYKVFFEKNGKLYPPMVANPGGADTPVGVWLNADVGTAAPPSKTGRLQVKAGGKGTQGGSGSLAFRPGWHLGDIPKATQFNRLNKATGVKELFPYNFVWAECEYAMDVDYQEEAMSYGYNANGKFQHSLAGLPKLPVDGYYHYRTNPDPNTVPWVITGAMKVNKILSRAEVDAILREKGVEPTKWQGPDGEMMEADGEVRQYSLRDSSGNEVTMTEEEMEANKEYVANMEPVASLHDNPMSGEDGTDFFTSGTAYFKSIGGKAENPVLGRVDLNEKGIRHLINRRLTWRKTALLRAVMPVIEKGRILHVENDHNNKDTAIIAAVVRLDGTDYYMGVVVSQNKKMSNTYELHDAVVVQKQKKGVNALTKTPSADANQARRGDDDPSIAIILSDLANYNREFSGDTQKSIRSPEFQRWFGDSKVVDSEGNPLVVYHGSPSFDRFTKFRKGKHGYLGPGIYLTDAEWYAQGYSEKNGYGGQMYSLYAKIENPLYVTSLTEPAYEILKAAYGNRAESVYKNRQASNENDAYWVTSSDIKKLMSAGYDGIIWGTEKSSAREYVVFEPTQIKSATDNAGTFDPADPDIRYSARSIQEDEDASPDGTDIDASTESAYQQYSIRTWAESDYVAKHEEAIDRLVKTLHVEREKAAKWIDDVNSISAIILDNKARLDYIPTAVEGVSAFKSNPEYGGSIDMSTICAKRRLATGTLDAIQNALGDAVLTKDDFLHIREMMKERGHEVACGLCFVESSRKNLSKYTKQFLDQFNATHPNNQVSMTDFNTVDGLERTRLLNQEAYAEYEKFMNKLAQRKPKLFEKRTEYRHEILQKFKKDTTVGAKNINGGLRLQSFSDFEIVHLIDMMQVITDMASVGLAGQAYTKVPDFAWALGDTGLKINLSLIAKDVDEDGNLIFDDVEGMNHEEAKRLRDAYSENVGTIVVAFTDEQIMAAMKSDFVDFIIPFHRSQWQKSDYKKLGLPEGTKDYTMHQNEKLGRKRVKENYMPNDYWDFSKTGKQNAQKYLDKCAADGRTPKFAKFLQDNGDGTYSMKDDGSTDGYWKLLIDFKMYDNNGVGSPQNPVQPNFNMDEARRMLDTYNGIHDSFPVAQDVVDDFVAEYTGSRGGVKVGNGRVTIDNVQKSQRLPDDISTREYLADADSSIAANAEQANALDIYKTRIAAYREATQAVDQAKATLAATTDRDESIKARNRLVLLQKQQSKAYDQLIAAEDTKHIRELTGATTEFIQKQLAGKTEADIASMIAEAESEIASLTEQLDGLKGASREQTESVKEQIRMLKARVTRLRNSATRKLLETRQHYQEMFQRDRTRREINAEVTKKANHIKAVVKRLDDRIRHETDYHNVKEGMKPAVRKLVETFLDGFGNLVFDQKKADRLLTVYRELDKLDSDESSFYSDDVEAMLAGLAALAAEDAERRAGGGSLMENAKTKLSIYSQVADIADNIWHMVQMADEIFVDGKRQRFADVGDNTGKSLLARKDYKQLYGRAGKLQRWADEAIRVGNMTPTYFFEGLKNSGLSSLFQGIANGQTAYAQAILDGQTAMQEAKKRYHYAQWANQKPVEFKTKQGHTFSLTVEQMMWAYATAKREASNDLASTHHLSEGGFRFEGEQRMSESGKGKHLSAVNRPHKLASEDIEAISNALTAEQKAYADEMVRYLSEDMAELGNAASMEMFGIRKYQEKYYFPFKTASEQRYQRSDAGSTSATNDSRVKHSSFTHRLTRNANTTLVMGDFSAVVADHINQMATYASFMNPVESMNRVLNYKVAEDDGTEMSIRSLLERKYGAASQRYVQDFLKDINGGVQTDTRGAGFFNALIRTFKRGAVASSLSTAVQQPTSYLRAFAYLDPKYFAHLTGTGNKEAWAEAMRYSGTAVVKDMGKFDVGLGQTANEWISKADESEFGLWERAKKYLDYHDFKTMKTKWSDLLSALPGYLDRVTWTHIWKAVKAEQADLHPGMNTQSEAFLEMCGKRFDDVINHTQVYDSIIAKSSLMRSSNALHQMATAFKSEPTLTANVLYNAVTGKHSKGQKAKMITATVASNILAAAFAAAIGAWNKDDDERTALEKYLDKFGEQAMSNLNPLNMLPYLSDISSMLDGYDVERLDMSVIADIIDYTDSFFGTIKDGNAPSWKQWEDYAGTLLNMLGVPAKNISRDIRRFRNAVTSNWRTTPTASAIGYTMLENLPYGVYSDTLTSYYERYASAVVNGNKQEAYNLRDYLSTSKKKDDSTIATGFRKALKALVQSGQVTPEQATEILREHAPYVNDKDNVNKPKEWAGKE